MLNFLLLIIPTLLAIYYPNVGQLTAYIGTIAAFLTIYMIPIAVHVKARYTAIKDPELAFPPPPIKNFAALDELLLSSKGSPKE